MRAGTARVVWCRFWTTFGHRWGAYMALVVLIGLIGGIAMGSIAAARRTQSSYPAFLAATHASDLTMSTYGIVNNSTASDYSPMLTTQIAHLPEVTRVESWVGVPVIPVEPDGAPNLNAPLNPPLPASRTCGRTRSWGSERSSSTPASTPGPRRSTSTWHVATGWCRRCRPSGGSSRPGDS